LAKLSSIPGIPVPDGFIVSAQAYMDFVLSLPEVKKLLYLIKEVTADQTENILQLSKRIRQEIEKINFPIEIMEEISKALIKHGNTIPYAVRSSATAEDLPGASFA